MAMAAKTRRPNVAPTFSAALIPTPSTRQALLEELDVERRLERLVDALDALLSQITGQGGRA